MEAQLCNKDLCLNPARIVFKADARTIQACRPHQHWAVSQLLELSGGRPLAIAIAHIAFRFDINALVPTLSEDQKVDNTPYR